MSHWWSGSVWNLVSKSDDLNQKMDRDIIIPIAVNDHSFCKFICEFQSRGLIPEYVCMHMHDLNQCADRERRIKLKETIIHEILNAQNDSTRLRLLCEILVSSKLNVFIK